MKKVLIILVCFAFLFISCERLKKRVKHVKSEYVGLERIVTLYSYDGKVIKQWEGKFMVEIEGGLIAFIDDDGKEIKVMGVFTVEEK